jgi:hypothetical protein
MRPYDGFDDMFINIRKPEFNVLKGV